MGRYTTVQAYADNNPNMRAVDYAQATGTATGGASSSSSSAAASRGPLVTEKVDNPYGSTAGAGSGEFHVYRHARAREMARWEKIGADEAEARAESEYRAKVARDAMEDESRTEKRRRKREREKEAKRRKRNMRLGGVGGGREDDGDNIGNGDVDGGDEFEYTPIVVVAEAVAVAAGGQSRDDGDADGDPKAVAGTSDGVADLKSPPKKNDAVPFPNDGSFLERMKRELLAEPTTAR